MTDYEILEADRERLRGMSKAELETAPYHCPNCGTSTGSRRVVIDDGQYHLECRSCRHWHKAGEAISATEASRKVLMDCLPWIKL